VLSPDMSLKLRSVEEKVVANSAWTSIRRTMVNLQMFSKKLKG
jgi:hypothetical protein